MEVREGYKMTEVGVIPEDWEAKKILNVSPLQRGFDLPKHKLVKGKIPVVYSNGIESFHNLSKSRGPGVITGRSGTIGKVIYVDQDFWPHNTSLWVTDFKKNSPKFIYFLLTAINLEKFKSGSGVPTLNRNDVHDHAVRIPPLPEQSAIAEVLSDADALIQSLETLIEKKRNIKKGAMQDLLTGKRRLPGFEKKKGYKKTEIGTIPEDWEVKKLSETATLKARIGWQGLTTAEYLDQGDYYLITGTDFDNGQIDWQNCCFVEFDRYKQDINIQIKEKDILVTKDGTIGKVAIIRVVPKPATLNSGIFVIRPKNDSFDQNYFYFLMMSTQFRKFLSILSAGSTINHLYQKDFVNFKYYLPKQEEEQKAIATILSDMDEEITQLETKLEKYKKLKRGMMQELLTGRTRLI